MLTYRVNHGTSFPAYWAGNTVNCYVQTEPKLFPVREMCLLPLLFRKTLNLIFEAIATASLMDKLSPKSTQNYNIPVCKIYLDLYSMEVPIEIACTDPEFRYTSFNKLQTQVS